MRSPVAAAGLFAAIIVLAVGRPSQGEERKMTALQIFEALAGNTVEGVSGRTPYRSYFRPDGVTLYQPDDGPRETGKWRVDEEKDQYCAWWARSGWSCYEVYRDGRQIIWVVPYSGKRYPSRIIPGKQL